MAVIGKLAIPDAEWKWKTSKSCSFREHAENCLHIISDRAVQCVVESYRYFSSNPDGGKNSRRKAYSYRTFLLFFCNITSFSN